MAQLVEDLPRQQSFVGSNPTQGNSSFSLEVDLFVVPLIHAENCLHKMLLREYVIIHVTPFIAFQTSQTLLFAWWTAHIPTLAEWRSTMLTSGAPSVIMALTFLMPMWYVMNLATLELTAFKCKA